MKNLFIPFMALVFCSAFFGSCASDSCSFQGKWKVKSADVQSSEFSASVIEIAKNELLATQYEFSKKGEIVISHGDGGRPQQTGTWTFDNATQIIQWSAGEGETKDMVETSQVTSCTGNEINLSQRIPADTTKEELARVSFILEKM